MTVTEISQIIAVEIIETFANSGALMHNQLYETIHDMDTNKLTQVINPVTAAMIGKAYLIIKKNLELHNAIIE